MWARVECLYIEDFYKVANIICVAATNDTLKGTTDDIESGEAKVVDLVLPVGEQFDLIDLCEKLGGFNG